MCRNLTMLAGRGERLLVARCEHETIHLIWNRTSFMIHPMNFSELVLLLESWLQGKVTREHCIGCVRLAFKRDGGAQLWIADAALDLRPFDLSLLAGLVIEAEQARHSLDDGTPLHQDLEHTREYTPTDRLMSIEALLN